MRKHIRRLTTKSEGWVLTALEENEKEPKQKYVRFLINKAWLKPNKINKFYNIIDQHIKNNIENTVIILKS